MLHHRAHWQTDLAMRLLLAHLRTHRKAADTFEGIERWWLGANHTISPIALRAALQRLVEAGALLRRDLSSGEPLWYVPDRSDGAPLEPLNEDGRP